MHLSKVNEALSHRIVGGSEYHWKCYGPDVRYLDYESDHAYGSTLFSTLTQEVYESTVTPKDDTIKPYRWLNPDTKQDYLDECKVRDIDPHNAWDDVNWVDLETEEDFLDKAEAVFNGDSFDERVQVPLDLDRDEMFQLMKMAHERDITLNQMVEEVLWAAIDKFNAENKEEESK